MERKISYEPHEDSIKPYHVQKPIPNSEEYFPCGRRYTKKGLFNLVETEGEIKTTIEEGKLYIISKHNGNTIRYIVSKGIVSELIDFKEKRNKESLEQKV